MRYEFRVFGARPPGLLAVLQREGVDDGEEDARTDTYFVSNGRHDAALKLREGTLDLKLLRAVHGALELWEAAAKSGFPISETRLRDEFLRPAGIALDLGRGDLGCERLIAAAGSNRGVRLVWVEKRRHRWRLDGAGVEVTRLTVAGRALETVAVEAKDVEVVETARDRIGLVGHPNVSYPRMLDKSNLGAGAAADERWQ